MAATETDDESLVGEAAHIIAEEDDGPRADPSLARDRRDKYDNVLLLCRVHHKLVDDQEGTYTVAVLREMKQTHENRVRETLDQLDRKSLDARATYASYVDDWVVLADVDNWTAWTSHLMSDGQHVLADLLQVFQRHIQTHGDDYLTEKFYKLDGWDPERYKSLARDYDVHVGLVEELTLELTRAANLVCDEVRKNLDPAFRVDTGVLLAMSGPDMTLHYHYHRAEYGLPSASGRTSYPGLDRFAADVQAAMNEDETADDES